MTVFKKIMLCLAVSSLALAPAQLSAAPKKKMAKAVKPTGAERARQYKLALEGCQKKYGAASADMYVEWATNFGQTGWWCVSRRN
jgi:hypothetical protein